MGSGTSTGGFSSFHDSESPDPSLKINQTANLLGVAGKSSKHFTWVGDLALGEQTEPIDSVHLADEPKPPLVAARVDLTSGEVATESRTAKSKVHLILWKFKAGNEEADSLPQPLTEVIRWRPKRPADGFELHMRTFGSSNTDKIVFKKNGGILVRITNFPTKIPPPVPPDEMDHPIDHFKAYYSLLPNPPPEERMYVPSFVKTLLRTPVQLNKDDPETLGVKPVRCIPGASWAP